MLKFTANAREVGLPHPTATLDRMTKCQMKHRPLIPSYRNSYLFLQ